MACWGATGAGQEPPCCPFSPPSWQAGQRHPGGEPVWENQAALDHLCFAREAPPPDRPASRLGHYLPLCRHFLSRLGRGLCPTACWRSSAWIPPKLSQLSRGQLSMVSVLTALASRLASPLLDEPTAGLDAVAREQLYRLLLEGLLPHRAHLRPVHPIIGAGRPLRGGSRS